MSKLFWMMNRNTAKKTSRNTTSFTPGMLALPSIFWEILMSWTVNTNESTPHPMGRMATSQTPALPSICSKPADSTPSTPIDESTLTWLSKIQLQQSLSTPHIHALMSSAMPAQARSGTASRHVTRRNAPTKGSANLLDLIASIIVAPLAGDGELAVRIRDRDDA